MTEPPHDKTNKMTCAPSEDSDQPGHPPSLVRVFGVRMKKHWALTYLLSAQWRLWSDWTDAQADLSLHWAHMSFCCFCRAAAHVSFVLSSTLITSLWEERIGRCAGRLLVCPRSVVLLFTTVFDLISAQCAYFFQNDRKFRGQIVIIISTRRKE